MKKNVMHRNSKSFIFKTVREFADFPKGAIVRVKKDGYYQLQYNDKSYQISPSLLRNTDLFDLRMQWEYFSW